MKAVGLMRSEEVMAKYKEFVDNYGGKDCLLCKEKTLFDFKHWRIVENRFPWDKLACVHHLVLPKRCVVGKELNNEEIAELQRLKEEFFDNKYESVVENLPKRISIPNHFHLHLIVVKSDF